MEFVSMKNIIGWIFVLLGVLKLVLKLKNVFQRKESVTPMLVLELAWDVGRVLVRIANLID